MVSRRTWADVSDVRESIWHYSVRPIKTVYGKLAYVAGLRDPDNGMYRHYGRGDALPDVINEAVRRIHEQIFREWLTLSLERKQADVELYLNQLEMDTALMLETWLRLMPYKNIVPPSFEGAEREKHESDIRAILMLLTNVYGVASGPSA